MRPLLLVLILCIGASFSTAVRCQPSPVLSSSGSGFFVSYDGHVLTNNHVVEDCSNLKVEQPGSGATIATVIARDVNNDLALLRTYREIAKRKFCDQIQHRSQLPFFQRGGREGKRNNSV